MRLLYERRVDSRSGVGIYRYPLNKQRRGTPASLTFGSAGALTCAVQWRVREMLMAERDDRRKGNIRQSGRFQIESGRVQCVLWCGAVQRSLRCTGQQTDKRKGGERVRHPAEKDIILGRTIFFWL